MSQTLHPSNPAKRGRYAKSDTDTHGELGLLGALDLPGVRAFSLPSQSCQISQKTDPNSEQGRTGNFSGKLFYFFTKEICIRRRGSGLYFRISKQRSPVALVEPFDGVDPERSRNLP